MLVTMNDSDINRFKVIQDVCDRRIPSNNRYPSDYRDTVLKLIRDHYSDFSPTLAREKLFELHSLPVSNETLRSWMIADGLWTPHSQRKPKVYQPRYRRDCLGELVQIDGSHHDWFEGS
ncbi:transposase [Vibrio jasicida]|nr:transposase [Vibrio jasicida]